MNEELKRKLVDAERKVLAQANENEVLKKNGDKEKVELVANIKELNNENATLNEEIAQKNQKIKTLEEEVDSLHKDVATMAEEIEANHADVSKLRHEAELANVKIQAQNQARDHLMKINKDLKEIIDQRNKQIEKLKHDNEQMEVIFFIIVCPVGQFSIRTSKHFIVESIWVVYGWLKLSSHFQELRTVTQLEQTKASSYEEKLSKLEKENQAYLTQIRSVNTEVDRLQEEKENAKSVAAEMEGRERGRKLEFEIQMLWSWICVFYSFGWVSETRTWCPSCFYNPTTRTGHIKRPKKKNEGYGDEVNSTAPILLIELNFELFSLTYL